MNDFTQLLFVDYCSTRPLATQPLAMGRLAYMNRNSRANQRGRFPMETICSRSGCEQILNAADPKKAYSSILRCSIRSKKKEEDHGSIKRGSAINPRTSFFARFQSMELIFSRRAKKKCLVFFSGGSPTCLIRS